MGFGSKNGFDPVKPRLCGESKNELPMEEASISSLQLSSDPRDSDWQIGSVAVVGNCEKPEDALPTGHGVIIKYRVGRLFPKKKWELLSFYTS